MSDERSLGERAADDPELMRLWGEVNNAWDDIEALLYRAFDSMLLDTDPFETHAIFYSQYSHAGRRKMVEELSKVALMFYPEDQQSIKGLIGRVRARSDDRNELAHGAWAIQADLKSGRQEYVRMGYSPSPMVPPKTFGSADLVRIRDSMRHLVADMRERLEPMRIRKAQQLLAISEKKMARIHALQTSKDTGSS